jgi:hypothetical protein
MIASAATARIQAGDIEEREFLRILDPFHGFMRGLRAREVNPLQIGGARAGGAFDPARGAVRKTRMERGSDPEIGLHNVDYAT